MTTAEFPVHNNQHLVSRANRGKLASWWWTVDHALLAATGILIAIGMLLSFTSSPAAAIRLRLDDPLHFAIRQAIFGLGACGLVLAVSILSPRGVKRAAFFIYIGAILCMAVAVAYYNFWPRPPRTATTPRTRWQHFVLRWFHALTWLLLALASLALKFMGIDPARVLGLLGLTTYLIFMAVFVRERLKYPQG